MKNNKLISFLIPTRKRIENLENAIQSILKNLNDTTKVEILIKADSDDSETLNYIKTCAFNALVDIHLVVSDRGKGYEDLHIYLNSLFKVSKGKWIIPFGDDMWIESDNWYEEILRLDSLNKLIIPKLNSWNFLIVPREIPELWGHLCPNQWLDQWYHEVAMELDLYEDCNIRFEHIRVMQGETAEDREKFFREIEKSPKWINDQWKDGPPSYNIKERDLYIKKLKEYMENKNSFSEKLNNFFTTINKINYQKDFKLQDSINCHFVNGPFVEITGNSDTLYNVEFVDLDTNDILHTEQIKTNHWVRANRQWFTNCAIRVYTDKLIFEHIFNAKDKKVYIHIDSKAIGDTLAWFPYIEEFRKKHKCKMVCSTFHNDFFEDEYKEIEFVNPGTEVNDLYAMYQIGIYEDNFYKNKNDHKQIPLQQISSDILGIDFKEIRPLLKIMENKNKILGKYVVISTDSTAQCKYWNNKTGWQETIDYLNSIGYKVVVLQKGKTDLKNIVDRTGNNPLSDAISILHDAEFMIGISSGISWLAWALKKKVILISGFTSPWYEFNKDCYRIFNKHSCNGCWHKYKFDKGDWNWCPMDKNFECSSTITSHEVITQIRTIIENLDLFYTEKNANSKINMTNSIINFKFGNNKFNSSEIMFYEIFRDRSYDFYNHCRIEKGDVVVDIGANIGIFAKYAIANGASKIYCFEPIKSNYDLLFKNCKDNNKIETLNLGVSDTTDKEIFYLDASSGGHTLIDNDPNKSRTGKTQSLYCTTLNDIMQLIEFDKIDFLKIDTEGAELKIMNGISDENLLNINKISMEWHDFLFNDNEKLVDKLIKRMSDLKFKFYHDHMGNELSILYFWRQ